MRFHAPARRLGALAALTTGATLFATSVGGIAAVDATLSAAVPAAAPSEAAQVRVVEPVRGGSDCPRERRRDAREV